MATAPNNRPNNPTPPKATTPPPPYTSPVTRKKTAEATAPRGNQTFLFDRDNYLWMFGGLACIILGFMLMSGGKSPDPHVFNDSEVYSFRRITLAPIVVLIGFAIEAYAIMKGHTKKVVADQERLAQ